MNTTTYRAAVLSLTWLAGTAGHETGDYLVQSNCDAQRKQQRTRRGRLSLARHAITYGLTQAATKEAAYRVSGLRVPLTAKLAGTLAEIAIHTLVDDGRLLAWFAAAAGKADHEQKTGFFYLGDAAASGRSLIDQAMHKGLQIPLGALITTALAVRSGRRR
ncbi:hypothetical protein [Amycolatopsis sp. NPDC051903]|uniref:hypothetical protein n=1 Tax=Amycolatopsis sp. NPDC051903 TaxID=3363936 RepID=UPI0037BCDD0C